MSTYMYECMIDFVCSNLYLIRMATHVYNRFYFFWQLLFKCVDLFLWQFVYELMCMTPYFFFNLCVWHLIFVTTHLYDRFYFVRTYTYNKLCFCDNFIFMTTYKYFLREPLSYICGNLYMYIVATPSIILNSNLHINCY